MKTTGRRISDLYRAPDRGWTRLRRAAGLPAPVAGPQEKKRWTRCASSITSTILSGSSSTSTSSARRRRPIPRGSPRDSEGCSRCCSPRRSHRSVAAGGAGGAVGTPIRPSRARAVGRSRSASSAASARSVWTSSRRHHSHCTAAIPPGGVAGPWRGHARATVDPTRRCRLRQTRQRRRAVRDAAQVREVLLAHDHVSRLRPVAQPLSLGVTDSAHDATETDGRRYIGQGPTRGDGSHVLLCVNPSSARPATARAAPFAGRGGRVRASNVGKGRPADGRSRGGSETRCRKRSSRPRWSVSAA